MNVWVEAARPRTLTASLTPVIVGTAAAERSIAWRAACAFVVSLSLQIAVNYANDLFDAESGVDTEARVGPRRVVAAGLVSPAAMRRAIAAVLSVGAVGGVALAAAAGWELLLVGLAAVLAALTYSGGPRPYAAAALGEVMVFVFFGVVATAGSAYVQDEIFRSLPLSAAVSIGALAAAVLVANNLRDIETDRSAGKDTLAVRLGRGRTITVFRVLVGGALAWVVIVAIAADAWWPLAALTAAPLALRPLRDIAVPDPRVLIAVLGATARLQLVFGVLLAIALWLSS